jgi:hypothetical protein
MDSQQLYNEIPFVKRGGISTRVLDRMPKQRVSAIIAKRALIAAYNEENEPETCIVDLLADLRHLCDALGGLDFNSLDVQAYRHYAAEVVEARLLPADKQKARGRGAKLCGVK